MAEALECYRQGRMLLSEELGLDPGQELQRLERAMVAREPGLDLVPAHTAAAGRVPAPAQLPPDVADFTGRDEETARLRALLAEAGTAGRTAPVVVAISGQPGVGKTALAVRVAHELRERFPDGQLHVDLRGAELEPAASADVLGQWLRELGVEPASISESADARARMFRSRLTGKRILVLLDNASSESQVRALLPASARSAAIITSRSRLAGLEAAHFLELEVLDVGQGLALLAAVAGRRRVEAEPEAARSIIEACGRLPLALRVAGARLAGRTQWRLDRLAALLHDERRRLDELSAGDLEVRASVALSYQALDARRRRAVRLLGLLETPDFGAWTAAALLDERPERAEALLEDLADRNLLEPAGQDRTGQLRYRFHDLIRVYARERLAVEEAAGDRREATRRVVGGYLALAERALPQLGTMLIPPETAGSFPRWHPTGDDLTAVVDDALGWFEAERAGLVTTVVWAAAEGLTAGAWELAALLTPYFELRSHSDDWRRVHEAALGAARRSGDRAGESEMLRGLGHLHDQLGEQEVAIGCFTAALGIASDLDRHLLRAGALLGLGSANWNHGRLIEAIPYLEESLRLVRSLSEELGEALALRGLGVARTEHGEMAAGHDDLARSLAIFRRRGHRRGQASVLYVLGVNSRDAGEVDEAAEYFGRSLALYRETGDRRHEAYAVYGLGTVRRAQGRLDEARRQCEQALRDFRRFRDRRGEAYAQQCLGLTALDAGAAGDGLEHLQRALALAEGIGDRRGVAAARHGLGLAYGELGLRRNAAESLGQAIAEYEALACRPREAAARADLFRLLARAEGPGEEGGRQPVPAGLADDPNALAVR